MLLFLLRKYYIVEESSPSTIEEQQEDTIPLAVVVEDVIKKKATAPKKRGEEKITQGDRVEEETADPDPPDITEKEAKGKGKVVKGRGKSQKDKDYDFPQFVTAKSPLNTLKAIGERLSLKGNEYRTAHQLWMGIVQFYKTVNQGRRNLRCPPRFRLKNLGYFEVSLRSERFGFMSILYIALHVNAMPGIYIGSITGPTHGSLQPDHYDDHEEEEEEVMVMIGIAITLHGILETLRNPRRNPVSVRTSALTGSGWLYKLMIGHPARWHELGLKRNTFISAQERFQHSGSTISHYFGHVLSALLKLEEIYVHLPPPDVGIDKINLVRGLAVLYNFIRRHEAKAFDKELQDFVVESEVVNAPMNEATTLRSNNVTWRDEIALTMWADYVKERAAKELRDRNRN
ncbi:hypothetical protein BC829DRAFT_423636 [Chytridium lagenaria]|nr:hypothetical protein BC829DRAFT_423636 [Chytridium lagenaria]